MIKKCKVSNNNFEITNEDLTFYDQLGFNPPSISPDERCRRRLVWQNMSVLYKRKCSATGKDIISNISEDKLFPVYDQAYWWSPSWNFQDYGRDFDFSKTFFENFKLLLDLVPQPNLTTNYLLNENSDYTNYAGSNKDCYLIFHADMNRDCLYGVGVKNCTDCIDILHTHGSELLYEAIDCRNCYSIFYSEDCENCSDSYFIKDCLGCKNCFCCINLRQKQYCIFNKQVSKDEYLNFINNFDTGSRDNINKIKLKFEELIKSTPLRSFHGYQNENVSGDQIFRSQNVHYSFDIQECRDLKFCHRIYNGPNSDAYDVNEFGMAMQNVCEGLAIGENAYNILSCIFTLEQVRDIAYSMHVHHAKDIFGCISVVNSDFCILNKKYPKEEYFKLKNKIITHMKETKEWGEFFPIELSYFGYNETVANEYFPLTEKEALKKGLKWKNIDQTANKKTTTADHINDIDEQILNKVLYCKNTGKPYKIQKNELNFYKKNNLPIPEFCYNERHRLRFEKRNPRRLFNQNCSKCNLKILSSFEKNNNILCENCYNLIFV